RLGVERRVPELMRRQRLARVASIGAQLYDQLEADLLNVGEAVGDGKPGARLGRDRLRLMAQPSREMEQPEFLPVAADQPGCLARPETIAFLHWSWYGSRFAGSRKTVVPLRRQSLCSGRPMRFPNPLRGRKS